MSSMSTSVDGGDTLSEAPSTCSHWTASDDEEEEVIEVGDVAILLPNENCDVSNENGKPGESGMPYETSLVQEHEVIIEVESNEVSPDIAEEIEVECEDMEKNVEKNVEKDEQYEKVHMRFKDSFTHASKASDATVRKSTRHGKKRMVMDAPSDVLGSSYEGLEACHSLLCLSDSMLQHVAIMPRTPHGGHKAETEKCCELLAGYRRVRNTDGKQEDKLTKQNTKEKMSDLFRCKLRESELCRQEPNCFAVYITGKLNAEPGAVLAKWKETDPCSPDQDDKWKKLVRARYVRDRWLLPFTPCFIMRRWPSGGRQTTRHSNTRGPKLTGNSSANPPASRGF